MIILLKNLNFLKMFLNSGWYMKVPENHFVDFFLEKIPHLNVQSNLVIIPKNFF
jgi:hypothetical protein